MHLPGRLHFQALLHLLHHLRCYSPQALTYYRDVTKSPLATMLQKRPVTLLLIQALSGFAIHHSAIVMIRV